MPDDRWHKWDGSRAFVGEKPLMVRFRNGKIASTWEGPTILPASSWHGKWDRGHDWPFDIVEVRQVG